jgi:hypothetical protein
VLPALQSLTKKKCITQWKFLLHCFSPPNLWASPCPWHRQLNSRVVEAPSMEVMLSCL